jgi:hypothetical protein
MNDSAQTFANVIREAMGSPAWESMVRHTIWYKSLALICGVGLMAIGLGFAVASRRIDDMDADLRFAVKFGIGGLFALLGVVCILASLPGLIEPVGATIKGLAP